ncbi:MAG: glycoside hydrolase family 15 protein [Polyangiaceae bacterium]|nr:glycoside hydrolase family 15 protein [Polyangiaceae bacterium]
MPLPLEDYALIGDCETAALVGRDGSIDWLCLPRFDAGACFAALLGSAEHGRWLVAPAGEVRATRRCYRGDTLVLETEFETADGVVALIDCMPPADGKHDVVRIVEGRRGRVAMLTELVIRFDYGSTVPWVRRAPNGIVAIAGPDLLRLETPVPLHGEAMRTLGTFSVAAGERVPFVLTWSPSHLEPPRSVDAEKAVAATETFWRTWAETASYRGPYRDAVMRSLVTLKALTYGPTGGIVAAPTASLPERIGGERNWDYRYCWLRDATFTLYALLNAGYRDEARAWRDWLERAVAGRPEQAQIMYGIGGERRLPESELAWLPGYEASRPVRIGNAAAAQFQLDVYGEVLDTLHLSRRLGLSSGEEGWRVEKAFANYVERVWREPDEGIWEVRGPRRHFTYSKVMAWVALDRAVKAVENYGLEGPADRWRTARAAVHAEVCHEGYDQSLGSFVQHYGGKALDASLLLLPAVGFLPAHDPRMRGTVEAIERSLMHDGLVLRYPTEHVDDGLPPGEGAFLACSFWLVDNYVLLGRRDDARRLFERLISLSNDVGLLAEEYDPVARRLVGNFPQAFSHISLVNSARNLADGEECPAEHRPRCE